VVVDVAAVDVVVVAAAVPLGLGLLERWPWWPNYCCPPPAAAAAAAAAATAALIAAGC